MNFEMFNVGRGIAPPILAERAADTIVLNDQGAERMDVYNNVAGTLTLNIAKAHAPIVVHGSQDPCVACDLANGVGTNGGQENIVCYECHGQDSRVKAHGDLSPTLTGKAGTGGGNLPLCLAENIIGRDPKNGGNHLGVNEDVSFTLNAAGVHVVSAGKSVRRLTPTECERLMGFPDDWTRIPWRGKPAEECPDSPRYKACGNSWAVNVARWVMKRIALADSGLAIASPQPL
ncbi:MAG: DNA cytosine methyltransferase [Kiritimatiellaeota bacterium]|nr:DNA cytosine methyltransferase [Kiritimatiellota bacterium]